MDITLKFIGGIQNQSKTFILINLIVYLVVLLIPFVFLGCQKPTDTPPENKTETKTETVSTETKTEPQKKEVEKKIFVIQNDQILPNNKHIQIILPIILMFTSVMTMPKSNIDTKIQSINYHNFSECYSIIPQLVQ